jgi:tripartite-type tricarboxylate transporter receptor subunit TctC
MREIGVFTNAGTSSEIMNKLQKSLNKILSEYP